MLVGTIKAAELLGITPRMVQRYVESGALVPATRTPGGFCKFHDYEVIKFHITRVQWRAEKGTSRGSLGEKMGLLTRTGTILPKRVPFDKVSILENLLKLRDGLENSSSKDRPALSEMLD